MVPILPCTKFFTMEMLILILIILLIIVKLWIRYIFLQTQSKTEGFQRVAQVQNNKLGV